MKLKLYFLLISSISGSFLMGDTYGKAFEKTAVNKVEVKTIPATTQLVTSTEGSYFNRSNRLFRKLFNYINKNKISMTVPVEAELEQASMKFYVGTNDLSKATENQGDVKVVQVPERLVVSMGARGSYREKNVEKVKIKLEKWLAENSEYEAISPAYAVFWNGPFTFSFLKRFEVHIPVRLIKETPLAFDKNSKTIEVKKRPATTGIITYIQGNFFQQEEKSYLSLREYFKKQKLTFLSPVEVDIESGTMIFYTDEEDFDSLAEYQGIYKTKLPECMVVSISFTGDYSEKNIKEGILKLKAWLQTNTNNYKKNGNISVLLWDGPFYPGSLKTFEVQIPIIPTTN